MNIFYLKKKVEGKLNKRKRIHHQRNREGGRCWFKIKKNEQSMRMVEEKENGEFFTLF